MNNLLKQVTDTFKNKWSSEPEVIATAPGRVNLIGEHTDYTGGFVLPVAIDREIIFAVSETLDNTISGYSVDYRNEASCTVGSYDPAHPVSWFRYVLGVLSELENAGHPLQGFRFVVGGTVPIGSGLSSSAAFEMAVLTAIEGLQQFKLSDADAALLCQKAENDFVGMNCGIMDQYISRSGKKDHAVLIDCTDLSIKTITMSTPGYSWLVIDSMKRRGLVDSEYNRRRQECEEGLKFAQSVFPERNIQGLRDITIEDLRPLKKSCDPIVFRRIKHIITENDRVLNTVEALQAGDINTVGTCLYQSHESLRDDFEVSCKELDMLVEILSEVDGVAGARMTGGGFGGCVISLIKNTQIYAAEQAIQQSYKPVTLPAGTKAEIWPIRISDGAHIIKKA
ncbi:MAG: galactokinase [Candidatus Latescibacteria bacterium]|nr:galactokinase [Candidatus Latescibacterota bacterium]